MNSQDIIEKMVYTEVEYLRKLFYKYQRRPLLYDKLQIELKSLNEEGALGMYSYNEDTDTHIIYIDKDELEDVESLKRGSIYKKIYGRRLKNVIRHELIHAFVNERYMFSSLEVEGVYKDCSPIFLAICLWANVPINYYAEEFNNSEIANIVKNTKTFDELETLLIAYLIEYKNVARHLKSNEFVNKHNANIKVMFASKRLGMEKALSYKCSNTFKENNKLKKVTYDYYTFTVGGLIPPSKIQDLALKKINNTMLGTIDKSAKVYSNVTDSSEVRTIRTIETDNKLN